MNCTTKGCGMIVKILCDDELLAENIQRIFNRFNKNSED